MIHHFSTSDSLGRNRFKDKSMWLKRTCVVAVLSIWTGTSRPWLQLLWGRTVFFADRHHSRFVVCWEKHHIPLALGHTWTELSMVPLSALVHAFNVADSGDRTTTRFGPKNIKYKPLRLYALTFKLMDFGAAKFEWVKHDPRRSCFLLNDAAVLPLLSMAHLHLDFIGKIPQNWPWLNLESMRWLLRTHSHVSLLWNFGEKYFANPNSVFLDRLGKNRNTSNYN